MAVPSIRKIPPHSISEFRESEDPNINIPEVAENRKCTDVGFLIFFVLTLITTIILVISCIVSGTHYNRFLNGYDKCGDTCGTTNERRTGIQCSGKDLTDKPFMRYAFVGINNGSRRVPGDYMLPDTCVNKCNDSDRLYFHRCIPPTNTSLDANANRIITFAEFADDFCNSVYTVLIPAAVTGTSLSIVLFICFYLRPSYTVFGILGTSLALLLCFTIYVWYEFVESSESAKGYFIAGIISTIVIFFLAIFICYFQNRYLLLIEIFIEAKNIIFKQLGLVLVPVMVLLILGIVITSIIFLAALLSTNSTLQKITDHPSTYEYSQTQLSAVTITFLVLLTIWILAFANGCQCMIVAAPVAAYYFQESCYILMRFHLGTVAFGSLFITVLTVSRITVDFLADHIKWKCTLRCLEYCIIYIEEIVEYLTKRAYIQSAIHGNSLYKSGMRAARLLWANLMDTISIDVVGDFVMYCATILMILISVGMAICIIRINEVYLTYFWMILLIGAGISGISVYFFTQVLNVTIETIFICFCEDKLLNDGQTKPYLMSDRLRKLVDDAKKVARRQEEQ